VRIGRPALEAVESRGLWAYLNEHPDEAEMFDHAMTGKAIAVLTGGGHERTASQLEALLTRAGFVLETVLDTPGPVRIAEARAV
jgi:hypothetical protein